MGCTSAKPGPGQAGQGVPPQNLERPIAKNEPSTPRGKPSIPLEAATNAPLNSARTPKNSQAVQGAPIAVESPIKH